MAAFAQCSNLQIVNISMFCELEEIPDYAVYGCESVVEVKFEGAAPKLKTTSNYAFGGVSKLESIVLPDGVTTIGDNAFDSCTDLTRITIQDSVTNIFSNALSE